VAKEKSPAFQFYPKDWLSDAEVRAMTPAQRGIYIDLLAHLWTEQRLPLDPTKLARLLGLRQINFSHHYWPVLAPRFETLSLEGVTYLTHKRLDEERAKQLTWREKSAAGGRKSAAGRAKGGSGLVQPPLQPTDQPKPNSPSPSPSPEDERARALTSTLPPEGINPKPKPNPNIVNPGDPVELVRWQFDEFVKRATPAFKADAWMRVDAWVRKVGESTRAKGETVTAPSKDWWAARFAHDFARSTRPKANALVPDADYREWYERTQLQQQKDDAA
jgi:uncharacterized protein YdaU (DUF1376 family)